jgi:hypothetical protein
MADALHPFGDLDVVDYYSKVSSRLFGFLKGKEIAAKVLIPKAAKPFLNRGSFLPPLSSEELAEGVNDAFLKQRSGGRHLDDAKGSITPLQGKIWRYFPPRKLADLFYAVNGEKGKTIDRIFIDIDRSGTASAEDAQAVAKSLLETIKADKEFAMLAKFRPFAMYTGSSFHVYLMLEKPVAPDFYSRYVAYSKSNQLGSFIGRWCAIVKRKTKIDVVGGHEKLPGHIIIDPSQTPPGKLGRCPFSLHMSDASTVDGVAIPLEEKMLDDKSLVKKMKAYTPEKVLKELDELAKRLPP